MRCRRKTNSILPAAITTTAGKTTPLEPELPCGKQRRRSPHHGGYGHKGRPVGYHRWGSGAGFQAELRRLESVETRLSTQHLSLGGNPHYRGSRLGTHSHRSDCPGIRRHPRLLQHRIQLPHPPSPSVIRSLPRTAITRSTPPRSRWFTPTKA